MAQSLGHLPAKRDVVWNAATYQACLHLRLLLCRGNDPQRQEIANELVTGLSKRGKQHTQALITISNLYLRDVR